MHSFHTSREVQLNPYCTIESIAQSSVLLRFSATGDDIDALHTKNVYVQTWLYNIQKAKADWLVDIVASYTSLLIEYDANCIDFMQVAAWLKTLPTQTSSTPFSKQHCIDVCYDVLNANFPSDISEVASQKGLKVQEVIKLHSSNEYRVFAVGFMPNFAYLGELPASLMLPRLQNPRLKVPAGAVAIADNQTAVYPAVSPGGWHIIGYTYAALNDASQYQFSVGDSVVFKPISKTLFLEYSVSRQ